MNLKKITTIVILLLIAVISLTKIAPTAANPANHKHSIEQTDAKIATVMKLSGGAAAASATLSLLPGDLCTPISEQLADLASYFLLILSALYLEKFMITLTGYVSFSVLIPAACLLLSGAILLKKKSLSDMAARIGIVGIVIFLLVPSSIWLSDKVYQTQSAKVESTIEEYSDLNLEGESDSGLLSELSTITTDTIDKVSNFLKNMLESLAVMIVTACVIPLLVFVLLVWIVKTVFSSSALNIDKLVIKNDTDSQATAE
ncbi:MULTISPECIES: hypothetical protein [Butyrivibrio]|uniref:hypothetical protein n=1 Tax=Butyrivibrio TaxID=830 RepID=UPI0003FD1255|nr:MULTISPECIES: hypothetical protein [Butyrivibrio]SFU58599.1 hypothetical protein SAMN05216540_104104 [Butyrivibrio sp. M55]